MKLYLFKQKYYIYMCVVKHFCAFSKQNNEEIMKTLKTRL